MIKPTEIKSIAKLDWTKRWAGSYTFISISYWGRQYRLALKRELGIGFNHSLFIHKKGIVSFYLIRKELDSFGNCLAKQATKNNRVAFTWCKELKKNTDILIKVMNELQGTIPSHADYKKFLKSFDRHLPYHNAIKKTVDYFSEDVIKKMLPLFKEARLYSESIYSDTGKFFRSIMKTIGKKEKYNPMYLTCLTQTEFEMYLQKKKLPNEEILKDRYQSSVLYFSNGKYIILSGTEALNLEKLIYHPVSAGLKEIKGISAYNGIVVGRVRIVHNPHNIGIFNKGDILVTGMTRPEFLPIAHKAKAIITDAGGILCHAAITSRELKIPCIVGTQIATTALKDGDIVEVDANIGIIKIN